MCKNTKKPTRCVVLTGGIACGKTVISDQFKALGVPVFDTDLISRELCGSGKPLLKELTVAFGNDILNDDGSLNRRALRLKVFGNDEALEKLNAITHPAIMKELKDRISNCTSSYAVAVIPLFFEGKHQDLADRVLVADADEQTQLKRLIARDHVNEQTARAMITSQVSRDIRRNRADDLIETDRLSLSEIKDTVIKLHEIYQAGKAKITP